MDHPHLSQCGRLTLLFVALAAAWALTGADRVLARSSTARPLTDRCTWSSVRDDEPPTAVMVPEDEVTHEVGLISDAIWAAIAVLLAAGAYGLGRSRARRVPVRDWTDDAQVLWRAEADVALPEPERPCLWACKVRVDPKVLRQWEVKRIILTPMPVLNTPAAEVKAIDDPKLLAPLNDLGALADIVRHDAVVEDRLRILTHALVARTMGWSQDGCAPAAFRVEAQLAVPVSGTYELYQSQAGRSGLTWSKPLFAWRDAQRQSETVTLGVILGPKATELHFAGRLQEELLACLRTLVQTARWTA